MSAASTSSRPLVFPRAGSGAAAGQSVIACQQLSKVFKDFWMRSRVRAVDRLDLDVQRGEIFGLLGPNGSGKSTTIKIVLGLLHKSSGRVAVFGKLPTDVSIKKRIGYLPEETHLYPFLNSRETLDYYAKLFELDYKTRRKRIDELIDMVGLGAAQHRPVREYSKGMARRIGLAQALINDPELLILDEPTSGLDPIGSRQVKDLILELGRRGKTVLLSSHLLGDVEDCVDRLVILYGGKKRAEGTPDELLESRERTVIESESLDDATIAELDRIIHARTGRAIERVGKPRQRLEDLFLDIVDRARRERVETGGAQSGGATASFLRADEGEGDDLIGRLVEGEPPPAPAPAPGPGPGSAPQGAHEKAPERTAQSERDDVLGELLADAPKAPEKRPASEQARDPKKNAPPADVDRSVIDSLLDDDASGGGTR
ncbi:MAG: ABC transporter ATP-binding protein [Phycisphaeraceae bacterium]|nr:ABC transporter ATP-binding protein [Phycisphaeraceae bacterium]